MQTMFLQIASGIAIGLTYASLCEWLLHRYLMHRPWKLLRYPFETHTIIHHHVFKADASYHLQNAKDKDIIRMAWWNGPTLVAISQIPWLLIALFTSFSWWSYAGITITIAAYYATYEVLHWFMHLPKARRIECSWFFRRLNGHHLLHHRYMGKNFNVVFPLFDLLLGTLVVRSKTRFAQPIGTGVPNVQPIEVS